MLAVSACSSEDGPLEMNEVARAQAGMSGMPMSPTPEALCSDPSQPMDSTALIDDMEDGTSFIIQQGARNGSWWTAGDEAPGAFIEPAVDSEAVPEAIPGGRCGSAFAMRVTGQGFTDWGALLGFSFVWDESSIQPYAIEGHVGLTFWARIGDTSTNRVRLGVSDRNSEPSGGLCIENGALGESCHDTFGTQLTELDASWRRYRIPFSGLTQRQFGLPADALDTAAVYSVHFFFDPGAVFDFWVDDVEFY